MPQPAEGCGFAFHQRKPPRTPDTNQFAHRQFMTTSLFSEGRREVAHPFRGVLRTTRRFAISLFPGNKLYIRVLAKFGQQHDFVKFLGRIGRESAFLPFLVLPYFEVVTKIFREVGG